MQKWAEEIYQKIASKMLKTAEVAKKENMIPYMSQNGKLIASPFDGNGWWTGGFWPGMMWQLYHATADERFKDEARRTGKLLTDEIDKFDVLNHDVGFMYMLSCGSDYRLTGDKLALRYTMHAANLLAGRFNPTGFIRAWNGDRAGWAIIDCMMNLCLLHFASEQTSDPRFDMIATLHADMSIREFLREDGSCNHIVIFDPYTGQAIEKPGGQGYAVGSSWSRGQAWALYGFVLSYRNQHHERYLETAMKVADYFISNIRPDGLTDCDFRQPKGEERIDNIAAACAACGLLELSAYVNKEKGEIYCESAFRMLRAIDKLCADWSEQSYGILQKCTASYHDDGAGRHCNIFYGDYFFTEAIARLCNKDAKLWAREV